MGTPPAESIMAIVDWLLIAGAVIILVLWIYSRHER